MAQIHGVKLLTNPGRWKADFQKSSTKYTKSTKFGGRMQTCGKTVFAGASLVDVLGRQQNERPQTKARDASDAEIYWLNTFSPRAAYGQAEAASHSAINLKSFACFVCWLMSLRSETWTSDCLVPLFRGDLYFAVAVIR